MEHEKKALELFHDRCNCAQSVLAASVDEETLSRTQAFGAAALFGGGLCRTGRTCGAVTGALMAIGLKHGPRSSGEPERDRQALYERGQRFLAEFELSHGSLDCRELTGCDLRTPEGQARYREGLHEQLCSKLVADAARMVAEA